MINSVIKKKKKMISNQHTVYYEKPLQTAFISQTLEYKNPTAQDCT